MIALGSATTERAGCLEESEAIGYIGALIRSGDTVRLSMAGTFDDYRMLQPFKYICI